MIGIQARRQGGLRAAHVLPQVRPQEQERSVWWDRKMIKMTQVPPKTFVSSALAWPIIPTLII